MSRNSLFISYGHGDMAPVHWLDRLKLYLAPLRERRAIEFWDDSRIKAGALWREEIANALGSSTASILLVGPAFLASDFIKTKELPGLLGAAKIRGAAIYPLVVGYCGYRQSVLEPYQAFNDPDTPLEALSPPQQNKILNDVSVAVDSDLRHAAPLASSVPTKPADIKNALRQIARELRDTATAFVAQCSRRDKLYKALRGRLKASDNLEFENFFFRYYTKMNEEEKFQFQQLRAMTEGPLHNGNLAILRIIEGNPQVLDEVPSLLDLRQHIVFWLNNYDKVFLYRPEMCLLYTGVEDGVPFPQHAEEDVDEWLKSNV